MLTAYAMHDQANEEAADRADRSDTQRPRGGRFPDLGGDPSAVQRQRNGAGDRTQPHEATAERSASARRTMPPRSDGGFHAA